MKQLMLAGIVILTLLTMVACGSNNAPPLDAAAIEELGRMPDDLQSFAFVNVERLRDSELASPVMDSLNSKLESKEELQEILEKTGFDIRRDVRKVYIAFGDDFGDPDGNFVAVATGEFDPQRIVNYIKDQMPEEKQASVTETQYHDHTLYSGPLERVSIVFADDNHLVAGTTAEVQTWLDHFRNDSGQLSSNARGRLEKLRYKNGAWITLDAKQLFSQALGRLSGEVDTRRFGALRKIETFDVSMDVDDRLMMQGEGVFSDQQNAGLFRDALVGALATAKLSMTDDRDAIDTINKIAVESQDRAVTVSFALTRAEIERVTKRQRGMAWR